MDAMGINSCLRISVMPYNNQQDIIRFISELKSALSLLNE